MQDINRLKLVLVEQKKTKKKRRQKERRMDYCY